VDDAEVADAVERFKVAANEKGECGATAGADARLYSQMRSAWRHLYDSGLSGRAAFKALLCDPSTHVRRWVAAQLLSEGDLEAVEVLQELAAGSGLSAAIARATLDEWQNGRLGPPLS
jgi:hypothetical protein